MAGEGAERVAVKQQQRGQSASGLPTARDFGPAEEELARPDGCQRPYPKKVGFIVADEFCERFSYYGLRAVLVLYFKSVLGLTDSASTVSFHLFASLCYLTPIMGAVLADSVWGKYRTIVCLSVVYFLGELILLLASIFWHSQLWSSAATLTGLLLIGIGTGGIKPCVGAFGGDQFHAHEQKWRESFFSLFYAAINLGSLISMFLTPMLRSNFHCVGRPDCYPLAFGVPCALMLAAILIFVAAQGRYSMAPLPKENIVLAFCKCVWLALKRKFFGHHAKRDGQQQVAPLNIRTEQISSKSLVQNGQQQQDSPSSSSLSLASGPDEQLAVALANAGNKESTSASMQQLVPAKLQSQTKGALGADQLGAEPHWLYLASDQFERRSIEEFRCVLGILLLFLPTPLYWCLYDQQSSLWTLQATRMDGRVPGTSFVLEPDQMGVANPLLLLISIALFQLLFYPCLEGCNLLRSPIKRMTAGGLLAAAAFVSSALIELHLQAKLPAEAPPSGLSRVLLVNGLSDCSLLEPSLAYVQIPPSDLLPLPSNLQAFSANSSSRSDMVSRTCGVVVRAVTAQSILRTSSSPGWYGRASLASLPGPGSRPMWSPCR